MQSAAVKRLTPGKVLGVFSLVMINVIAVDSLRTLPISAEYGASLIFYYGVAALLFFLPTAFVTAELATTWPKEGGVYVWVREAFGRKWGFFVIWLQWIYNVVWYPTILSFVVSMLGYLFNPDLAQDQTFVIIAIFSLFWLATLVNCFGMRLSSFVSSVGSIIGTLLPMALIIYLGTDWFFSNKPMQIHFSWDEIMPKFSGLGDLVLFSGILYGLVGLEMSAVHAQDVRNPGKDYPRSLWISSVIVLFSLVFASLAIALVVPREELSIVTGMLQAFELFFDSFQMGWMVPVIAVLMVIGGMGSIATWIIGPTKGMHAAARDGELPAIFSKTNRHEVPVPLLILQGLIFSLLTLVYWFMPTVKSAYWVLTELTAQMSLLQYAIMFAAAVKLRYKFKTLKRPYRIPGPNLVMWVVAGLGLITSISVFSLGYVPPSHIEVGDLWRYEVVLIGGILLLCSPPLFIHRFVMHHRT